MRGRRAIWIWDVHGRAIRTLDSEHGVADIAFSADGSYLYVGNFLDQDVSILKVDGTRVTDTGKRLQLPGHPASMRGRAR